MDWMDVVLWGCKALVAGWFTVLGLAFLYTVFSKGNG